MRIYGKNPVLERLKENPHSIMKIHVQEGHADAGYIYKKAKKWGIPVHPVDRLKMGKMSRNLNMQGVMAVIGDYQYMEFDDLIDKALAKKMCLVFLDRLKDPQNLGGIIRSLACLGGFGIVLPTHDSVSVTESVIRVACGGENYVPIAKVANLKKALRAAKDRGFSVAGTAVQQGEDIMNVRLDFPLCLIIGSEEKGISPVLHELLDWRLTLSMAQPRLSLNAAHATAIFCYEIACQRRV